MRSMRCLWAVLLTLLLTSSVFATELTGPVVSVLDGDTIEVLHTQHPERIRLSGIDCPEKGQAYGQRAKQAASALVLGKNVRFKTHGKDKYKRTFTDVLLPDGTNVNHELIKESWCWWNRKYPPLDAELESLEKAARETKKGLWVDPAPIPPWVYRKARRGQSLDLSDLVPLETETDGNAVSHGPPLQGAVDSVATSTFGQTVQLRPGCATESRSI